MKKTVLITALLFKVFFLSAWGYEGHGITAEIAKKHLSKDVLDSVECYLGGVSFREAAIWMDEVRKDPEYAHLKPTHYVNVEKDKTYVKVSKPNMMNKLDEALHFLENRKRKTNEEIKLNLLFLFHLVGDLHQPLHTGYGEDRGGNAIQLQFLNAHANLHEIWDTKIIHEEKISVADCESYLSTLSEQQKNEIQKIDFVAWMNESRTFLGAVYDFKGNTIDKNYCEKNKILIEQQLAKSGLRLASVLNRIFGHKE